MLWKDAAGGKHVREYQLSTEPSFAGEASLDPGYVEYQVERTPERGHPWERCLRMQSTYATHRDADADGAADADAAETTTDMQIHMGKDGDPWSAGCQTLPPAEFERFWHDLGDGADGAESGTKIGYTLVDRDADTQPIAGATETQSTQSAATVSAAGVTAEQLQQIMPDLSAERAAECLPYLNQAMNEFGITTSDHAAEQTAAFLAQLAHESGQLQYFEELADGSDYEGREDLGNTQPGDGTRYKGRGPIQLTGRANYREYGEKLGLDLENHPELASGLDVGFRIAGQYWKDHGLNELAAQGPGTFTEITERINGGHQGLESRQQFYQRAMEVLAGGLSTVDVASTPVTGAASSSSSTNGSSSSSTTDDGGASEVSDFSSPSSSTSTDPGCSVARSPAALQREMQAMGYDLDAQITAAILQLLDDSYDALIGALSNDSDFQAFVRSQPGMKRWRKGQPVPQAMIAAFLAKKMKRAGVTADPQGVLHARDGRPLGGWPDVQRALGLSPAAAPAAAVAA
ncbi:MAG: hypothetical protein IPJ65_27065 [Archangiaceae bacterium]|nr:hypothetical protein [Archangiaceae bacterium]